MRQRRPALMHVEGEKSTAMTAQTAYVPPRFVPGCIFCERVDQPEQLFENDALYVMPDKFPTFAGHTLIVSRGHYTCWGAATSDAQEALDAATARLRAFLSAAYGGPVATFENGVAGQTVFHAHLHLAPLRGLAASMPTLEGDDVTLASSWSAVADYLAVHGTYRYIADATRRLILPGRSERLKALGIWLAPVLSRPALTPTDVVEVTTRWKAWTAHEEHL